MLEEIRNVVQNHFEHENNNISDTLSVLNNLPLVISLRKEVEELKQKNSDLKMFLIVKQSLLDDKIIDLKIIDIRKKSAFADFIILGSGTSNRHIINMAKNIKEKIKKNFDFNASVEGMEQSNWVLIDLSSLVVNIFKPEARQFYDLEKIWGN